MNPFILSLMCYMAPLLFFYKDGFSSRKPSKFDMSLNKKQDKKQKYLKRCIYY